MHLQLVLFDFGSLNLSFEVCLLTLVFSLQVSELLILLILKSQLLVLVLLDVISESVLKLGLLLESLGELLVDVHILNIAVLEGDSKLSEFLVEFLEHFVCHFSLEIEDLRKPDSIDKCTDVLVNLSVEEFIEASSPEFVHEVLHLHQLRRHAEGKVQVH